LRAGRDVLPEALFFFFEVEDFFSGRVSRFLCLAEGFAKAGLAGRAGAACLPAAAGFS